ncbi:TetR/AcrR family transcriptional regulator [Desulfoluna spongiiphila]|uniref:Transcriptional regulator, TetR family n=1 Tax=Desulfoluna spongiiphila TaxID=419481 RepID=A0A1G5IJD0_9BACT|nr:TetR/AcrR family transcriptional regulator [Desulfoluna spongiiphila]SCY75851.1 transcriptional regulator, TetR family [Desulfoluna spongiiphila]VVS90912.1 dna-binding hth domain tetr-type [Desulfoluna spongiiphila]
MPPTFPASDIIEQLRDTHAKPAFEKIPIEKRERILRAAAREFAGQGFASANINVIAKKAGISIGSMYNYFESKEALFLTLNDLSYHLIDAILAATDLEEGSLFDKFERLLRSVQVYARLYPEFNQIYQELTSEGLSHLSRQLSGKLETVTARYYRDLLREARDEGLIAPDTDEFTAAFCMDNILVMLQYAYSSEYYSQRMKIFVGEDALENDEKMIQGIMTFIRRALTNPET